MEQAEIVVPIAIIIQGEQFLKTNYVVNMLNIIEIAMINVQVEQKLIVIKIVKIFLALIIIIITKMVVKVVYQTNIM